MPTLNQVASRIANLVNQPNNHELKERAKDMVKNVVANRIRQSVEKNGIDEVLKLSFIAPVSSYKYSELFDSRERVLNNKEYFATMNKVPTPVRILSDAPFMYVGDLEGRSYSYASSMATQRFRSTYFPTGSFISYAIINSRIVIVRTNNNGETINRTPISQIQVTGIFENPEQVVAMFTDSDGQDVEIPLPSDVMEGVILEILRTEFNMIPIDQAIKLSNNNTQTAK